MSAALPTFDWTRFWVARDGHLVLDDDGFLADPEGKYGAFLNPSALTFEAVSSRRCAVLLGEPGIGKTTELERVNCQGVSAPAVTQVLELNLNDYSSDSSLVHDLFDSPEFQAWINGSHELLLSLDSLDECMLRVETVANLLSSRLGRYPMDRLWLRIACRTAVWPQSLEQTLARLWSPEQFGVFELLPLRRKDIEMAAAASGVEPEAFLGEVISCKAVPFTIKPLTLRFLLKTFQRDHRLPAQMKEIYLEGCRSLCTETNRSRVETGRIGKLSADQRLAVAERLAALTVFAGRTGILQGAPFDPTEGDLSIQEVLGGAEEENRQAVEVTPEAIRETLDTGLFSARGAARLGWAHQTYAEFLAARYVIRHGFDTAQKISLVTHPGYSSRLVIPQLVQTTVCMVNMDPFLFDELVQDSPHVLLRSEAGAWDARQTSALTASLLTLIAELKLTDSDVEIRRSFSKLGHPDLASQLEPYIRDRTSNSVVRRVAIGIAEACRVTQLRESLLELALDRSDHQPTRAQAIYALRLLRETDNNATRQRLAALLATDLQEDDDDQIRGAVLSQVWPDLLAFEDLIRYLTAPKSSLIGAYWVFLTDKLAQNLQLADLPKALAWAGRQDRCREFGPILIVTDNIVKAACRHAADPTILVPLAEVVEARLKAHRSPWREDRFEKEEDNPLQDAENRHRLIQALIDRAPDVQSLGPLDILLRFREDDLPWLLQKSSATTELAEQKKWIFLVREFFFTDVERYWPQVFEATTQDGALAEELRFWTGPIALDSPQADRQRREWQKSQKTTPEEEEAVALTSLLQQIDLVLQETGAEPKDAWWRLVGLLTDWQQHEWNADIRNYRIWDLLDETQSASVVRVAQRYILEGEDLGSGTMSRRFSIGELAGFWALYLASSEAPDFCSRLSPDVVAKWTPIILRKPEFFDAKAEPYVELLHLASQKAPDLVAQKISQAIDEQNQDASDNELPDLDAQLQQCWNERFELLLMEKLRSGKLKPGFSSYLMEILLARGSESVQQWAFQQLEGPIPVELAGQNAQLRMALSFLFIEGDGWKTAWNRISALAALQDTLAQQTVNHLYYEFQQGRLTTLPALQFGEICLWIRQAFPATTLPRPTGRIGPRGIAEVFRGQLFNYLQKAGTPEAIYALQYMARLDPDDTELKWMLAEAQQALLRHTWIPPEPATILAMARRPNTRIIDSGEQLLSVIIESLERLQQKLHGHTPLVEFLWDQRQDDKKALWKPKDEKSLSVFVKSQLENELKGSSVVLNREVEIRRSLGKEIRQGQETDILVDAIARNPRSGEPQRITVIIEVKGCWNADLKTEMEEQLAERYVADSDSRHGLYLVGWFRCDAWDTRDYRRADTPKWSLQQAREHFQVQAEKLSQGGVLIRPFVLDAALR